MNFHSTRWSLVREAGGGGASARVALQELCGRYRPAVIAYVRRDLKPGEDVEDLVQSFFLELLESGLLEKADNVKGRFRSFLIGSLRHHLQHQRQRSLAARRGGGIANYDLAAVVDVAESHQPSPEAEFEAAWIRVILARALERLRAEAEGRGRGALFDELLPYLGESTASREYVGVASALSMRPNTVAVAVRRMRERYGALVREEVSDTVGSLDELDSETGWFGLFA